MHIKTETSANHVLDKIKELVDEHGKWEGLSLPLWITMHTGWSEERVRRSIKLLERLGVISQTTTRIVDRTSLVRTHRKGVRVKLLRPEVRIVKSGPYFDAVEDR